MEFMGKWYLWSPLANGYIAPGVNFTTWTLGLSAAQPVDINDAIYNLYASPTPGQAYVQSQCMWTGTCKPDTYKSPPMWLRADPTAQQPVSLTLTDDIAKASSFTKQQNGNYSYLLYNNTTPIYLNTTVFYGLCIAVLGNPFGASSPDMAITVRTESLATYRQRKSAANADFTHVDFRGADLSGIDFTGANFNGAFLDAKTIFPASGFRDVSFIGAHFDNVNFGGCDLSGADFTGTSLAGLHFDPKTKLAGTKFINVDLSNLDFSNLDMPGAIFTNAKLHNFNVAGATLSGANLANLDLTQFAAATYSKQPTLSGTSNQLTNLTGSTIPTALLNNNWQWIDLRNSNIPDLPPSITKLQATGAKLPGLNKNVFTGISLHDATLDHALLDGVGLSGADLTGASFIDASMHGTTLTNATLVRAQLTGAQLGSLGQLFSLPLSIEGALNAGQVAPLVPLFKQQNIDLSANANIDTLAANRVWQLNDQGNHIVYTIRLDSSQSLVVYGQAAAASLVGAYMPNATLTGANLYEVLASSAQFYGPTARLDGSAILEEAQLNDCNLSNLNLTQSQLMGANLSGAYLFNAKFNKANLSTSARGQASNLSSANLQGADFTDAQLYGADMTNAAVAINVPTKNIPTQGGVHLFSLPFTQDTHTLQDYTTELTAAATIFSLNPNGDAATLQKYVTALETNDLHTLQLAFLKHQPPIVLSAKAQIQTVETGAVWQIVDGTHSYTLFIDVDTKGKTELYAAPSLPITRAGFLQNNMILRWQASASTDAAGQQWLLDNDSENPKNFSTGYVSFILKVNGNVLDVYGTAVRIERMGDNNKLEMDTEPCSVTMLSVTNMNENTICPNGTRLSINQAESGKNWDVKWLRAITPPAPPTCVPTDNSWCPPTKTKSK